MNLAELKRQVMIETIIQEDLKPKIWKHSGDNIFTPCPFHKETKPSFSISTSGQFFYCFGCKAHGDVFDWIRQRMKVDTTEAADIIAKRVGLTWKGQEDDDLGPLRVCAEVFVKEAQKRLYKNKKMLKYVKERRVDDQTISRFRLGYVDDEFIEDFRTSSGEENYAALELNRPQLGDGALILPVFDSRGRLVRYYSHIPGEKYIGTSRKMALWDDRYNAYGLHAIKTDTLHRIILVEGHFDVLVAHSLGFTGTIGMMGLQIGEPVLDMLRDRGYEEFCFMYDGDEPGLNAYNTIDISQVPGLTYVAFCPDGKDPAEMSKAEYSRALNSSVTLIEWQIYEAMDSYDIKTITGQLGFISSVEKTCSQIRDDASRRIVIKTVKKLTGVELNEVDLFASNVERALAVPEYEQRLLQMAVRDAYAMSRLLMLSITDFSSTLHQRTFEEIEQRWKSDMKLEHLFEHLRITSFAWVTQPVSNTGPDADFLFEEVRDRGKRRQISATLRSMDVRLTDVVTPVSEIIRQSAGALYEGGLDPSSKTYAPSDLVGDTKELIIRRMALENHTIGYPLGDNWTAINELWGGIEPKKYHIIAGITSSGKSACAINWAIDLAVGQGIPSLYITGELDPVDIMMRAVSIISGVSCTKVITGDLTKTEHLAVEQAMEEYEGGRLHVMRSRMYSSHWMSAIEAYSIRHGIKIVFIDYLQQVQREKEHSSIPQYQIIEQTSARLQDRAYSDKNPIAIIAVCQLNRGAAEHGGLIGGAQYIGGAFGIAQDCDKHLQIITKSRATLEEHGSQRGNRIFVNEKNRSGRQGHRLDGFLDDGETYGTGTMRMGTL